MTDTWVSMGDEDDAERRIRDFEGFQVNADLVKGANPGWKFLHCMPRKVFFSLLYYCCCYYYCMRKWGDNDMNPFGEKKK